MLFLWKRIRKNQDFQNLWRKIFFLWSKFVEKIVKFWNIDFEKKIIFLEKFRKIVFCWYVSIKMAYFCVRKKFWKNFSSSFSRFSYVRAKIAQFPHLVSLWWQYFWFIFIKILTGPNIGMPIFQASGYHWLVFVSVCYCTVNFCCCCAHTACSRIYYISYTFPHNMASRKNEFTQHGKRAYSALYDDLKEALRLFIWIGGATDSFIPAFHVRIIYESKKCYLMLSKCIFSAI